MQRGADDAMMANAESLTLMDAWIILVEGFPGCGKSTTAQWLARQFRAAGRPAEWFYEQQRPHPMAGETPTPPSSWQDYFAARLARWSRLSQRVRSSGTVSILESAWLQGPVFLMLHRDLNRGLIKAFILKTVEAMRGADPALIYLSQPDPVGGMRRLFDRRGLSWGLAHAGHNDGLEFARNRGVSGIDGLLEYWREHNAVCEAIVRESGMPTLTVDPRKGEWRERRAAIARFLDLGAATEEPTLDQPELGRLVGEYRQGARTFIVSVRDGALELDGLLWPRNRLLPIAPGVFEAESWPRLLTFQDADGEVRAVRFEGPHVDYLQHCTGVYEKVR